MKKVFIFSWFLIGGLLTSLNAQAKVCICHRDCGTITYEANCVASAATGGHDNHITNICPQDNQNRDFNAGDCTNGSFNTLFFANGNKYCDWLCAGSPKCPDNSPAPNNDLKQCPGDDEDPPTPFGSPCGEGCVMEVEGKSFHFNVESGGLFADLFVCEVGLTSVCNNCTDHYFTLNGPGTYDPKYTEVASFDDPTQSPTSANVFLNDLYFGSRFYVKYCVNVKRLVVGDAASTFGVLATVSPSYQVYTGDYMGLNDYATRADLGAEVYADCTNGRVDGLLTNANGAPVASQSPLPTTSGTLLDLPAGNVSLCGQVGCETRQCVYSLIFSEAATCYREIKCVDGDCEAYKSTIYTEFDANLTFDCQGASCGG